MDTLQEKVPVVRQRDFGIDILRIVSALYVLILHILGRGGVLGHIQDGSLKQYAALFLNFWISLAFSAVTLATQTRLSRLTTRDT